MDYTPGIGGIPMKLLAALLFVALSGCANYATQQANAYNRGNFAEAERLAIEAIRTGNEVDKSWFNLGLIYERKGQRDQAVKAYTMSARYGNQRAPGALATLGAPVPAPDLVRQTDTSGVAAALDGFNRGYSGGINCTTYGFDDLKRTNCR